MDHHLVKCIAVLLLFPAIENFYCARHSSSPSFPRVSKIESFCEWCQALECSRAWLDQISLKQIVGAANQNSLHWLLQIIFLFNLIMQKILRRSPCLIDNALLLSNLQVLYSECLLENECVCINILFP